MTVAAATSAPSGPAIADAFGLLLLEALARRDSGLLRTRSMFQIVERDDGLLMVGPAKFYFAEPPAWLVCERQVLDQLDGRVLDIGAGAGRLALVLQDRGLAVTALDPSPGAVEVCRRRGVRRTVCATLDEHAGSGERYDCFALFGNNLGLLESRTRAPVVLETLAHLANPGARVVGVGSDPHDLAGAAMDGYLERNRRAGRLTGQWRVRERFENLATPWFDFLWCSVAELEELVAGTRWRLSEVTVGSSGSYAVSLVLR